MEHELRALIGRVRRRWLALVLLRTLGLAAAAAAIPALVAIGLNAAVPLDGVPLVLAAGVAIALGFGSAAAVVWRIERRPDDRRVARFIEERAVSETGAASLDDEIVSAVDAAAGPHPPGFARLVIDKAVGHLRDVPPAALIPPSTLRRASFQAIGGSALLLMALALAGTPLASAWDTALLRWYPHALRIDVEPGDVRVPAGAPLRIRAAIGGRMRGAPGLAPSLVVSAGGQERTVAMAPSAGGFEFAFESVDRTFTYKVTAGAAASADYTVTALFPPRVKRIDLTYRYPAFTRLGVRDEEDGGDIYGPAGTRVRLRIHTDKPIAAGELAMAGTTAPLARAGETVLETTLVLARDGSYRVRLTDPDGLRSADETEYFIRLMDDRPPDVRLLRPASDQQITPLEEVAIEARADDDYGISSFELVYAVAGRNERVVPFSRVSGTDVARLGAHLLAAEDLRVQPGDVITYYARARDVPRGKRPTEARSDIFFLEVRPFNEEFVASQSQAMAGGGDAQIESLIAAQKEIINATWNLERRAGAGRSADDVRAVAQAQAELKARLEQITGGGRGRGGVRPPFQVVRPPQGRPPGAGDPVAAAVEAMNRALRQLEDQKTAEALPHEMAALQGLLKAQAEIQRREVSRQQANGGGGSGRQGQDLSALFDKELQRQQRTNYENRSQLEERPDTRKDESALDRIRDLARRQEELSRRQRELAQAGLSEEELKRQLEKLTREQNELRQETDALAKQMAGAESAGRSNESPRQDGRNGSGQGGGGAAREASEEMRNAAGELQRQDPNAAAGRAERAAERLRQLEQQMGAGNADARERAAGDLRLEAQQVADAQRRIAAEAERLDKAGGSASADARRRLAGEKERLADRVDALQRAGERLGAEGAPRSDAAGAAAEGARELERQRVAERMRDTARQMRGAASSTAAARGKEDPEAGTGESGGGRPSTAQTEQQIARALDEAAGKFGGRSDAEARQLSDGLERGREIRDRLDRLERQLREAEQRAGADRQGRDGRPAEGRQTAGGRQGEGRQGAAGREGPGGDRARGSQSGGGGGGAGSDVQRLREEYARELQNAREELRRMQGGVPRDGSAGTTPEEHEWSRSAPGNESFKQDFGGWESLRKDVDLALEQYETAVSGRLAKKLAGDRLSAGGSERAPDEYRRLIAKYYELLARTRK